MGAAEVCPISLTTVLRRTREAGSRSKAHMTSIRMHVRKGELSAALQECSALLEQAPEHIQGRYLRGVCLDRLGRSQEALEEFSLVLRLDPFHANATLSRAATLIKLGQSTAALEGFVQGLELDEKRNIGKTHRKSLSTSTHCSKSSSSAVSPWVHGGCSLVSNEIQGKTFTQVVTMRNSLDSIKAPSAQECYIRGCVAERQGDYREAVTCFSAALDLNSTDFRALFHRASAYENINSHQKSLEDYSKVTVLNPGNAHVYHRRAMLLHRIGRVQEALSDLLVAISLEPQAEFYYSRGLVYANMHLDDLAAKDFGRTLELNLLHKKAHTNRGICYVKMGKLKEAISDFESAISLHGDIEACNLWSEHAESDQQKEKLRAKIGSVWTWDYINGVMCENKREFGKAVDWYTSAISDQEMEGELWHARSRCYLALSELDLALSDCKEAEDRGVNVYYTRGLIYLGLELYSSAQDDLRQATGTVPVLLALGYAYIKSNMHSEAVKTYTQALRSSSTCVTALHNRGLCHQHLLQHAEVIFP